MIRNHLIFRSVFSFFRALLTSLFVVYFQYQPITKSSKAIKQHYNVVIIGSGYGGSVAACRSARAGQTVCVLEKGQEWLPGDFPETMDEAFRSTYIDNEDLNNPQGKG